MGRSRLSQPLPWYQWNPTQWQGSRKVQRMSWAARGLYRELMDECWIKGSVPSTVNGIADLFEVDSTEIEPLLPQILRCFDIQEDGSMTSPFIEEIRTEADARRVIQANRRLGKDKNGNPRITTDSKDEPRLTEPNQAEPLLSSTVEKRTEEKEVPPKPPKGGTGGRGGRRTRQQILEPFGPEVVRVVNTLLEEWRTEDPEDARPIKASPEDCGKVVDGILKSQPHVTGDMLIQAARDYLGSSRKRYKAPQYFFGPEGPWDAFVRALMTHEEVPLAV